MARPVFLAAPEHGQAAWGLIDKLLLEMQVLSGGALKGSDWFVPHLQVGDVGIDADAGAYFTKTLAALDAARVVVAVVDGPAVDEGVAFLVGCAFAASKPVLAYHTDGRSKGPLLAGAATDVAHDAQALSRLLAKHLA